VRVEPDLTVAGHPEIFVVGDVARLEQDGTPLPGVAQVALQQGRYAGRAAARRIAGKPPLPPFRYRDKGSLATIGKEHAVAERGTMLFPGAAVYMEKIAVGPRAIDAIDITKSPAENVNAIADALGKTTRELDVVVLERERHDALVAELRDAGARVRLVRDGDVAPAIAAAQPGTGVDVLYGIGGTPEGVISAAALKCVGGGIQGRLWPRNDEERQQLVAAGLDPARVLHTDDLVSGQDVFVAATGVTTGALLRGVQYTPGGATTDSIVMRSRSGTVRRVVAQQSLAKLSALTGFEYT